MIDRQLGDWVIDWSVRRVFRRRLQVASELNLFTGLVCRARHTKGSIITGKYSENVK